MRFLILCLLCFSALFGLDLLVLKPYKKEYISDIKEYLVSEKLDGVRAFYDGKSLLSKNGHNFNFDKDFLKDFPPFSLDGELYSSKDSFEDIVSMVKTAKPNANLKYYVFDVPSAKGSLQERLQVIKDYLKARPYVHNIVVIKQIRLISFKDLDSRLKDIINKGGEGLVIRKDKAPYTTFRNNDNLKLKPFLDAECILTGYTLGIESFKDGKGAMECRSEHLSFKIGSGFSKVLRKNPPSIGSLITYKYYSLSKNKIPKHAVFLRVREID
ncbi:hypothetical protein BKH43_00730 [Helicobacter sp. 13S00401-1]|uniref:DNA ligase n=1 Tax=Helicobacter sp. 13S00401-1 TaxID=1905758 RepID=UPI000BA5BC2C|nr:DNA ligase [Helicobacter sp. 13S00401-1]PAF51793.1 hypothetical protein BKH43_00730 [Helicobacter sp. 13S00401-1]